MSVLLFLRAVSGACDMLIGAILSLLVASIGVVHDLLNPKSPHFGSMFFTFRELNTLIKTIMVGRSLSEQKLDSCTSVG